MRKIVTVCEYPPIPIRDFDWLAYFDGDEEGPQGWGRTKDAAIADLLENYDDETDALERQSSGSAEQVKEKAA